MIFPGAIASSRTGGAAPPVDTIIRSIDIEVSTIQRIGVPFTVTPIVDGTGDYQWHVVKLDTDTLTHTDSMVIMESSTDEEPTFTLNTEGIHVILLTVTGINTVRRLFWHKTMTVLPPLFTEGDADRVITLNTTNNLIDCGPSGQNWGSGEKVFLKRSGAYVGRVRFSNLNPANRTHILVDPNNRMEARPATAHGLHFLNCSNILFDGCGNPNEDYNFYVNANGVSTAHAVAMGENGGIVCDKIHLCGIETNTPTSGASGFRYLGDETATQNRVDRQISNFTLHNFKVTDAGHEGVYIGYTNDTDTGDGGPVQFYDTAVYNGWMVEVGRDPLQPCNQVANLRIFNIRIDDAATLAEPSHASYISVNAGCSGRIWNITGRGGVQAMSHAFGDTGGDLWVWNCLFECQAISGSSQTFIQVGDAPDANLRYWNWNEWGLQDTKIGYRIDSTTASGGTQDITVFTLINMVTKKGTSANFLTVDGTNSQASWVTNQGNLTYNAANQATALLDANYKPSSSSSPVIDGGVDITTYIPYTDFYGSIDGGSIEVIYDIEGYCVMDGDYFVGPYSGMELKLADL